MFAHFAEHSQNKLLASQGFPVFEYGTISALGKGGQPFYFFSVVFMKRKLHTNGNI